MDKLFENRLRMVKRMEELYSKILKQIGVDMNQDGLVKTPKRAATAMKFLTSGYTADIDKIVNGATFDTETNGLVLVKNVEFYSLCEHHLLPFFGVCSVGYIPDGKIIGLSKIPRIIDMYSRRLQVQERLTHEIAEAIHTAIRAKTVIVDIKAQHLCMMMRGIEKQNSKTVTSYVAGDNDQMVKEQFYRMLGE